MFEFLIGKLVTAPIIGAIFKPIADALLTAQKQKLDAAGSHEARVSELAQKALDLDAREAEVNAKVLIAEQGNAATRWVRPVWAAPFVFWTWKVVVYDLCLGWGSTPELKGVSAQLCIAISIAYFGGRSAEKVATTIAGAFNKKS